MLVWRQIEIDAVAIVEDPVLRQRQVFRRQPEIDRMLCQPFERLVWKPLQEIRQAFAVNLGAIRFAHHLDVTQREIPSRRRRNRNRSIPGSFGIWSDWASAKSRGSWCCCAACSCGRPAPNRWQGHRDDRHCRTEASAAPTKAHRRRPRRYRR